MSKLTLLLGLLLVLGSISAKRLLLRPLQTEELRELKDTLPEGRSLRTGLAALSGFTLGISKALVGVFIYDVITANVSSVESETNSAYAQQVCLNSLGSQLLGRSNDNEYNPYNDDDIYDDNLGRQLVTGTTTTGTGTTTTSDTAGNSNVVTCIILYRNR